MSISLFKKNVQNPRNKHSAPKNSFISSKIIDIIWPIKKEELCKFLSMTLLLFCILFIQNIIRALKDGIVTTMIGAETISFLKFWGVLPASFIITIIYVKLTNIIKKEYIFYIIILSFLSFFFVFAFIIFPNFELFHADKSTINRFFVLMPHFKWFILLLSNWSFSLFYIITELWSSVIFALLFWQFINSVTNVEQSKRFYILFGLLGQTGLFISGMFLENLPTISKYASLYFYYNKNIDVISVQIILSLAIVLGLIGIVVFWFLNNKIIDSTDFIKSSSKKYKMSVGESLNTMITSKYIRLITILLVCYGISVNLVENPWKAKVSSIHTTPSEYMSFVGSYLKYNGIATIFLVILGSNIIRHIGWYFTAMITPVILFTTGIVFFSITCFESVLNLFFSGVLVDPIMIAIAAGTINNVLTKSSKYTVFDSTKEMAYVPLDDELKTKGKAAADVLGVKLGKSLGAFLQSVIFIIIPTATYYSITIYLMCIFTIICIIWFYAVHALNIEYTKIAK